jgi:hypothetical protein
MDIIAADGIAVAFDPTGGVIDDVIITCERGAQLRPLHKAPWTSDRDALPQSIPLIEQKLAGDFFCAPFAVSRPDVPLHGWTANGDWQRVNCTKPGASVGLYNLRQQVEGARVTKEIKLRPGHPVVYQTHTLFGGTGHIPVAHHAMLHVPGGARLSFSEKSSGRTGLSAPETDPDKGRSILAYPQGFASLTSVRRSDGTFTDATFYPFSENHEDVVVLTEKPGAPIGWSAAVAARDGFVFFGVKDAFMLPQTVLWMSDGGRYYEPWRGRHTAVIGIEEAAVGFHLPENAFLPTGVDLAPGRTATLRYAFGAMPVPDGWTRVADITVSQGHITLTDASGDSRALPFDTEFLTSQ